jgi:putative spermidine/putrescine transport system ATP-binding protein
VRPERIEVARTAVGENVIAVQVLRDRFFGATRQVEVACGTVRLEVATATRQPVTHVRLPAAAIQFLHDTVNGEDRP